MKRHHILTIALFLFSCAFAAGLAIPGNASALTATPVTWNVIGLDSNTPASGPNRFPVGAKFCGKPAGATDTATFYWDSGGTDNGTYINLSGGTTNPVTITYGADGCADAFFEVEVAKTADAFEETRRYHISAGGVSTPTPRELYVERLISQGRNYITDIKVNGSSVPPGGAMSLVVGNTYTITLTGGTATQGYNQFAEYINFPNTVFRINSVSTSYSSNDSPYITNPSKRIYADACLWGNDPDSPYYLSCTGGDYKAGGNNVVTTYNITILGGGGTAQTLNTLLYDFSGASYHYNADYTTGARIANVIDPASLTFSKSFTPSPANANGIATLTFTIGNPNTGSVSGVNFSDTFPAPMAVASVPNAVTNGCGSPTFSTTAAPPGISFSGGTIAANSSCTVQVNVYLPTAGTYANTSGELKVDSVGTGMFASDTLVVGDPALPSVPPPSTCTNRVELARWSFGAETATTTPTVTSKAADVSFATASLNGATATGAFDTTTFNSTPSAWATTGYTTSGTGTVTTEANIDFLLDTSRYGGVTMSLASKIGSGTWGGTNHLYVFSNPGTGWSPVLLDVTPLPTSWTISTATAAATGTTSTLFRVVAAGSKTSSPSTLFLDDVVFTGCQYQLPTIAKSFAPNPVAVGGTSTLTFTLTNPNPATPAGTLGALSFSDTLPSKSLNGTVTVTAGSKTVTGTNTAFSSQLAKDSVFTLGGTAYTVFSVESDTQLTLVVNAAASASGTATAGLTLASDVTASQCGGTVTGTAGGKTISFSGGTLAGGASCTVSVLVRDSVSGPINNVSGFVSSDKTGANSTSTGIATASLTAVIPPSLAKKFTPNVVLGGAASKLTFTLTNANLNNGLSGIAFTDTLAGITLAGPGGSSSTCGGTLTLATPGSISFSGGTLPGGGTCTFSVDVVAPSAPGTYPNTSGTVSSIVNGAAIIGNRASDTLTVTEPHPAVFLLKQVATSPTGPWLDYAAVTAGSNIYYMFTIDNPGDVDLNTVSVSDPTLSALGVGLSGCSWDTLPKYGTATCIVGPVTALSGSHQNNATVTGYYGAAPYTDADFAIYATYGLSIAKNATESAFGKAGSLVHYSYTVTNTGAAILDGPITVSDNKASTTCPAVATVGDRDNFLDPGEQVICTATYTVTAADVTAKTLTNTASASTAAEGLVPGVTTSTVSKTLPLAADLVATKTDNVNGNIAIGGNFTWTLTVTNAANAGAPVTFAAGTTLLQDDLPSSGAGYVMGTVTNGGGTAGTITCAIDPGTKTLTCSAGTPVTIPIGGSFSIPVTVTATGSGTLANPRTPGSCKADPGNLITEMDKENNNCSNSVAVLMGAPTVTKSFSPASIATGETSLLTITITNPASNPDPLTGASFTDNYPAGIVNAPTPNPTITGVGCNGTLSATADGGSLTLADGTIPFDRTCSYSVYVTSSTAGSHTNSSGSVTSSNANSSVAAYASLSVAAPATPAPNNKSLYLYDATSTPARKLSRGKPGAQGQVTIPVNSTVTWTQSPAFASAETIQGDLNADLYLTGVKNKNYSLTVSLQCGGAPITYTRPTSTLAQTATLYGFPLANGTLNCPAGSALTLSVTNRATSEADLTVYPTSGASYSLVRMNAQNLINVDSVEIYKTIYPGTTKPAGGVYTGGEKVYIRAVVSDPFGSADINSASVTIVAPNNTTYTYPMGVPVATTAGTATFEREFTIDASPGGEWKATVTAKEGTENTVQHSRTASFQVVPSPSSLLPAPTVKKAFGAGSIAGGSSTTLSISLANSSLTTAITGVGFTDNYPSGLVNTATPTTTITPGCGGTLNFTATSFSLVNGSIPANTTCTYTINSVTSSTAGIYTNSTGSIISTNANTALGATASLSVHAASAGNKPLYLAGGAASPYPLSRNTPSNTASVLLDNTGSNNNAAADWTLNSAGQPLRKDVTISGGSFPLDIWLQAATTGFTAAAVTATLDCSTPFASPFTVTKATVNGMSTTTPVRASITLTNGGASQTCRAGSYLTLNIVNASGKGNSVSVLPWYDNEYSQVIPPVTTVVNVDSVTGYTAASPSTSTPADGVFIVGDQAFVRAVVSDPFGSFDINSTTKPPTVTIKDPSGTTVVTNATMSMVASDITAGTKTFEYQPTPGSGFPITAPTGTWSASVTAWEGMEGTVSNTMAAALPVALRPPVVSKSFSPASMPANAASVLTITLANPNPAAITGVGFTDSYPANMLNTDTVNAAISGTGCTGTVTAVNNGSSLAVTGMTIPPGRSCIVTANIKVTAGGSYTNHTGPVTSANAGKVDDATATVTILGPPTVVKSFTPSSIGTGDTSVLSIAITNPAANGAALTGAAFTDDYGNAANLKNSATPAPAVTGTNPGCGGTLAAAADGTTFTLTEGVIPVNTTCTYSVNVTRATAGSYANSITGVTTANAGSGAAASATLVVLNHPTATKSFGTPSVAAGGTSTLTISITNPNAATDLAGVAFTDTYPSGMKNTSSPTTSVAGPAGCVGTLAAAADGTSFSLTSGTIPGGATCTFTVSGVTTTATGSYINPAVAISSTNAGGASTNPATLTVLNKPTVAKAFSPDNISVGNTSLLTVTITNPNGVDITAAAPAFTDTYPAGIQNTATPNASTTCSGGTVTAAANGNTLSLSGGTISANGSCVVTVNVTGTAAGAYTNTIDSVATTDAGSSAPASANLSVAAPATGNKPLYLYGGGSSPYLLSRTPTPGTPSGVPIAAGGNAVWDLGATGGKVLQKDVIITANVPLTLYLQGGSPGNQAYTGSAVLSCSTPFSSNFSSALSISLNGGTVDTATITLTNGTLPQTCPAGSRLLLTISNTTAAETFNVLPVNGGNFSQAVLQASTVISVDSVEFYAAAYPSATLAPIGYFVVGKPVYVRAVVSDPFGSYDIASASITIKDPGGAALVSAAPMVQVADSAGAAKSYEYVYTPATAGNWSATVTAKEGTENTVTHSRSGTFAVTGVPAVVIAKTADKANVNPGDVITYTITVQNQGSGPGINIDVKDTLSPYTSLAINTYGVGAPFEFSGPTSGLTPTPGGTIYYDKTGAAYAPNTCGGAAVCYDAGVARWKIPMSSTFNFTGSAPYPNFTITYKVLVQ